MSHRPFWKPPSFHLLLASGGLAAAVSWLVVRVILGLDFTDELQYYGEISALVRTGRFFQDDLFIQQLGYFFLLPLFKLHAALFPDQSYLIMFGRLVLLFLYAGTGWIFWHAASQRNEFSREARLAGLGALIAWIPFQIFAPSYNSLAYLLIVTLVSLWIEQREGTSWRHLAAMAGGLAALITTYPPAGIAGVALAAFDRLQRQGFRAALALIALVIVAGAAVGAGMIAFHGKDFLPELAVAFKFSSAFGVGGTIREPWQLTKLASLGLGGCTLIWQLQRRAGTSSSVTQEVPRSTPWQPLGLAAASVLLIFLVPWESGDFAAAVFFALVLFLTLGPTSRAPRESVEIAVVGLTFALVFSVTSSNGVHNFGLGLATAIPSLTLQASHRPSSSLAPNSAPHAQTFFIVGIGVLILLNGVLHPYRERYRLATLQRVAAVPAFKGLWMSSVKAEALRIFGQLAPPGSLRGKRVAVIGPHPAFYFSCGGEPATPMFFMHYSGNPEIYAAVAERLFRAGKVDAVLVTNAMPYPLRIQVEAWTSEGRFERRYAVPLEFNRTYQWLTNYDFSQEIILLTRDPLP